jgi:hypothetical protein
MAYFRPKDLPKVLGDPKPDKTPPKAKKPLNPTSKKRGIEMVEYSKLRLIFLAENRICFIENCGKEATTIEHTEGRGINYLNINTWKPCCLQHNLELENNPELSKKYQKSKIHGGQK